MLRHPINVDNLLPIYREAVSDFLERAPLKESTVIFDGPGPGCSSHIMVMALLGIERLTRLKAVHFFSNSGYAGLFLDAKRKGQLQISRGKFNGFYRQNQRCHRIRFLTTTLGFIGSKVILKRWFFKNEVAVDALKYGVTENYADSLVGDLPPNFHFWTYNESTKKFCDIHAHSRYAYWTIAELVTSLATVSWLYNPFEKDNQIFSDAICCREVREVFRSLRKDQKNVLFWHMNREGKRANTIYLKAHQSTSGIRRLLGDFALFLMGMDNPEFDHSGELGLFELEPQKKEF